jgi:hypothetical protein
VTPLSTQLVPAAWLSVAEFGLAVTVVPVGIPGPLTVIPSATSGKPPAPPDALTYGDPASVVSGERKVSVSVGGVQLAGAESVSVVAEVTDWTVVGGLVGMQPEVSVTNMPALTPAKPVVEETLAAPWVTTTEATVPEAPEPE